MKSLRLLLPLFLLSTLAMSQTEAPKPKPPQTDSDKAFAKFKTLAGTWQGRVTADTPMPESMDKTPMQVIIRTTSRGNAVLHEMTNAAIPDDPITMFYLDEDRLLLTHYCDAGNRPRMQGKLSPDGKTLEFEFVDITGKMQHAHMHNAKFTFIDDNHHTEDWIFMMGDKPTHAHFDLRRTGTDNARAAK